MRNLVLSSRRYRAKLFTLCMALFVIFLTVSTVTYPKDAFESAVTGLNLWWNVVFPALLPFFILSEIMMGLGIVHCIGILLEPLMRPLFNVPGVGAFALSMGLASGYPMDAVITSKFRKNRMCSAVEAERLLSFTNTADPLFMFGAVAVGMFGMPALGATIALSHYLASFMVGLIFRFHGCRRDITTERRDVKRQGNILINALRALFRARREDGRSIGQLLGDAVKNSMNTILLVGGFIIVFSVFLRIMQTIGITTWLCTITGWALQFIGLDSALSPSIVSGLFEIDLGTMAAAQSDAPLNQKVAIVSAIIAWSGLSVHGQVASIVIESGIRMKPYIFGRFLHAVLAAILTLIFLNSPAQPVISTLAVPVWVHHQAGAGVNLWMDHIGYAAWQFGIVISILLVIGLFCHSYVRITRSHK